MNQLKSFFVISFFIISFLTLNAVIVSADYTPSNETFQQKIQRLRQEATVKVKEAFKQELDVLVETGSEFTKDLQEIQSTLLAMNSKPEEAARWVISLTSFRSRVEGREVIDRHIVGVVDILENSLITQLHTEINAIAAEIATAQKTIDDDEWTFKTSTQLPDTRNFLQFGQLSKADLRTRIDSNKNKIKELKSKKLDKQVMVLAALREAGVPIKNQNQYDALMNSPNGKYDIQIVSAAHIIKMYMEIKAQRLAADPLNVDLAKEYYAERATLTRALMVMHKTYLERIDEEYKPKVKDIISKSRTAITDLTQKRDSSKDLLSGNEKEVANRTIQLLQNQVVLCEAYLTYLDVNAKRVKTSLERIQAKYAVAESTYFAIETTNQIRNEILSANFLSDALNFEMPDIVVANFADLELGLQDLNKEIDQNH